MNKSKANKTIKLLVCCYFLKSTKKHEIIICNPDVSISESPEFQVVHFGLGNKFIAKFNQRADAENYVDLVLRGYVQFVRKDEYDK